MRLNRSFGFAAQTAVCDIDVQSKLNAEREHIRKLAQEQAEQRTSVVLQEQAQAQAEKKKAGRLPS